MKRLLWIGLMLLALLVGCAPAVAQLGGVDTLDRPCEFVPKGDDNALALREKYPDMWYWTVIEGEIYATNCEQHVQFEQAPIELNWEDKTDE